MIFREAIINDIDALSVIRLSVKENPLNNPALVTIQDYEKYLTTHGKGWLCEVNNEVIGFSIVDTSENNIWALFVHPEHAGKGAGKQLHNIMMDWYFTQTDKTVWLGTAPGTKAADFYRIQGWENVGMHGNELKFEMTKAAWQNRLL